MLAAHAHYRHGILPGPGGWLDQSAAAVDALLLLDSLVNHHEEIAMEKARSRRG